MTGCFIVLEDETMSSWDTLKTDAAYLGSHIPDLAEGDKAFARDLLQQFHTRGLSQKQEYWVSKLADRARERAERHQQPAAPKPELDLSRIVELFKAASTNLKKPFILVSCDNEDGDRLRLKLAGPSSKYAGQVYVYLDGAFEERIWLGRVDPVQKHYVPSLDARDNKLVEITERTLVAFAADPVGAATRYGKQIGACCFCGRTLTDDRSISVGYGPICAGHFGLPWGEVVEVKDFPQSVGARAVRDLMAKVEDSVPRADRRLHDDFDDEALDSRDRWYEGFDDDIPF